MKTANKIYFKNAAKLLFLTALLFTSSELFAQAPGSGLGNDPIGSTSNWLTQQWGNIKNLLTILALLVTVAGVVYNGYNIAMKKPDSPGAIAATIGALIMFALFRFIIQ